MLYSDALEAAESILGDRQIAESLSVVQLGNLLGTGVMSPEESAKVEADYDAMVDLSVERELNRLKDAELMQQFHMLEGDSFEEALAAID